MRQSVVLCSSIRGGFRINLWTVRDLTWHEDPLRRFFSRTTLIPSVWQLQIRSNWLHRLPITFPLESVQFLRPGFFTLWNRYKELQSCHFGLFLFIIYLGRLLHDLITDSIELQNDNWIIYWKGCGRDWSWTLFYILRAENLKEMYGKWSRI